MLDLPILNVQLRACHEDWQQMTPTEQGRHCANCNREVFDFTNATQADLEAARATSPDGRLCGRFRVGQLAAPPKLRPRLRRFLVSLVLVCGLGLSAREAVAQVRKKVHSAVINSKASTNHKTNSTSSTSRRTSEDDFPESPISSELILLGGIGSESSSVFEQDSTNYNAVFTYAEQMPQFREGGHQGALQFLQQHLRWPPNTSMLDAEGRVFVNFIVGTDGKLREFKVLKGLHPLLDAEALRVVQLLNGHYEPGRQSGRAVEVYYTIPVTFQR
ncbi:energy transducer TonB [Hymenobacter guriensis]|uniref:Energy transducer TonB n=1 Tax=Hymenobacter guriensis TaxID=2793065 RepID=A0ABS0L718_9BACT|nr:energy transducer TonB [Hymenobacter guriensis]MBG8555152.1 energy transducer TonB [Hymenobacter guriensis]